MAEYVVNVDADQEHWEEWPQGIHERIFRCRDCMYFARWEHPINHKSMDVCVFWSDSLRGPSEIEQDGFCAWGEPKEG